MMSIAMVPLAFAIFLVILTAFAAWLVVKKRPGGDLRIMRRYRWIATLPLCLYLLGNGVLHGSLDLRTGVVWDYGGVMLFVVMEMMLDAIG